MNEPNDSTAETIAHIDRVRQLLTQVAGNIGKRALLHDQSKLQSPEKEAFDNASSALKNLTYDSPEYRAALLELRPALDHHYAHNSHHPEHYSVGIYGMSLLDLVEMLADWYAAGERHADGSMAASLEKNRARFNIDPNLMAILENTAREMGWL
jgi:hypothetical protein